MSAPADAFSLLLTVEPADIDALGHASNIVYLRWVQQVAAAHWLAVAPPADQAALAWVVRRHEIDYRAPALLADELRLRTWVGQVEGLLFERHTEIERAGDGRLLARACSRWCPISARTGRPQRVTPELRALFSVGPGDRVDRPPASDA